MDSSVSGCFQWRCYSAEIPSISEGMPAAESALQLGLASLSFLDRVSVLTAELCAVLTP